MDMVMKFEKRERRERQCVGTKEAAAHSDAATIYCNNRNLPVFSNTVFLTIESVLQTDEK